MNHVSIKKMVLASAVFGIIGGGLIALPNQAFARVYKTGFLSRLDNFCPNRAGCREDVHSVNLVAGQTYVIDVMSNDFDTYMFLENSRGTVLRSDDDGGAGLNSRILFTPRVTGTYRIVVTSYNRGATGSYRLRVSP